MDLFIYHLKFINTNLNYDFSKENIAVAQNESQALRLLALNSSLLPLESKDVYIEKNWTIQKIGIETLNSPKPYILMKKKDNEDFFNLF